VVCAAAGIALAAAAWLLPAHLRAVDARALRAASGRGWAVREAGLELVRQNHAGAAELLRQAAREAQTPGSIELDRLLDDQKPAPPMTDVFVGEAKRQQTLAALEKSTSPAVRELLRTRRLTNTHLFAPSGSPAGQAFDAAVAMIGFLIDNGNVAGPLRDSIQAAAGSANRGGDTEGLEAILLDYLSLGQRLNEDQAEVFVNNIQDAATLSVLAEEARNAGPKLPALFAAVALSGQPGGVASYLSDFNQSGLEDLAASLRYGSGGVTELVKRHERLYRAGAAESRAATGLDGFCLRKPQFAVTLKCLLYFLGGFFLAQAAHLARRAPSARARPLEIRGARYAREVLFAMGFLLVALLVSEPFLAQGGQKLEMRLRLPTVGGAVLAGVPHANQVRTIMNHSTLLTLLLFFVLQALIYVACVVKLAEIRRQNVVARVKLKLLENEEHLFDAGLYLGFCGTIVSLILVSLGIIEQSLMAAYSSTSFGIIFVSIFKIFQLRPAKRELLLQAEDDTVEIEAARSTLATMP